jgi:dTDP-4-amino-4,6-dideoxygalactose transaminase
MGEVFLMIALVDLKRQYKTIQEDIDKAIRDVVVNTDFIMGADLKKLEEEFAHYCGAAHAVGLDSGTGALELALYAVGLKPGDEVIVPAFTFYATASAVWAAGGKPVFVDVEDDTANIDPSRIEAAITPRTKVILPVHLYGQPVNMGEIMAIARKHKLLVIEDACQAHGARIRLKDGQVKMAGSVGAIGCFSFYPGKNLGAYGDGGMIVTNKKEYADVIRLLGDYGRTGKYQHDRMGYNRRLDTIQAAVLRVKLKKLDSWNIARRKWADLYDKLLGGIGVRTIKIRDFGEPARHIYAIRVERRDELLDFLRQNGVGAGIHYPIPLHIQKAFDWLGYRQGDFPISEKVAKEELSLPLFPELTETEVKQVVGLIEGFFSGR